MFLLLSESPMGNHSASSEPEFLESSANKNVHASYSPELIKFWVQSMPTSRGDIYFEERPAGGAPGPRGTRADARRARLLFCSTESLFRIKL